MLMANRNAWLLRTVTVENFNKLAHYSFIPYSTLLKAFCEPLEVDPFNSLAATMTATARLPTTRSFRPRQLPRYLGHPECTGQVALLRWQELWLPTWHGPAKQGIQSEMNPGTKGIRLVCPVSPSLSLSLSLSRSRSLPLLLSISCFSLPSCSYSFLPPSLCVSLISLHEKACAKTQTARGNFESAKNKQQGKVFCSTQN